MRKFCPDTLIVPNGCNSPRFRQIYNRVIHQHPHIDVRQTERPDNYTYEGSVNPGKTTSLFFQKAKRTLILREKKPSSGNGNMRFIHAFVAVEDVLEDMTFVLDQGSGCPFDCAYCYLQGTLKYNPTVQIFYNLQDDDLLLREVKLGTLSAKIYDKLEGFKGRIGREGKTKIHRILGILNKLVNSVREDQTATDIFRAVKSTLKKELIQTRLFEGSKLNELFIDEGDFFGNPTSEPFEETTEIQFNAGELSDGLALDDLSENGKFLVPMFGKKAMKDDNAYLLFRTKSDRVDNLEGLEHNGNTVISFTLNAERINKALETRTATIDERIEAARKVQNWGYPVRLTFDPVVPFYAKAEDYEPVFKRVFRSLDTSTELFHPVTLGMIRLSYSTREIIKERNPKLYRTAIKKMVKEKGDEKYRFRKDTRVDIYSELISILKDMSPDVGIRFSSEPEHLLTELESKFRASFR